MVRGMFSERVKHIEYGGDVTSAATVVNLVATLPIQQSLKTTAFPMLSVRTGTHDICRAQKT